MNSLTAARTSGSRIGVLPRPDGQFWGIHLLIWHAYGAILMVPWLGIYPLSVMVPNKLVIAWTGVLVSLGLRSFYQTLVRRDIRPGVLVAIVLPASLLGGLIWAGLLMVWLGGAAGHEIRLWGSLADGVPQLSGALYHGLVLMTWSLGYLAAQGRRKANRKEARAESAGPHPLRLVLRDGRRSVIVDSCEISRVEAAGDYVRIFAGARRLLLRTTMTRVEATLPAPEFIRIHRSSIVRLELVRELVQLPNNEYEVILRDGSTLKASRTYAGRLRSAVTESRTPLVP